MDKLKEHIRWDAKGNPHSTLFKDKYFCTQNGYEESRHVAIQGNNLRERFSQLDPQNPGTFTIIETGFGTGLTFCCPWQLWEECAPKSWKLHFISIELYPLTIDEINRALSVWPVLKKCQEVLVSHYRPLESGIGHFDLTPQVRLTIVFEDVIVALKQIKDQNLAPNGADVWLLNGFSPFSNPLMWSEGVFKGMAPLSKKGTTLSTFTVAAVVRHGLEAQGFKVERVPGHGIKRHVLKGEFHG
jgi:tRNA 5-methylaminomethyl-2-thiouridine biosynthesis bifunctional protein